MNSGNLAGIAQVEGGEETMAAFIEHPEFLVIRVVPECTPGNMPEMRTMLEELPASADRLMVRIAVAARDPADTMPVSQLEQLRRAFDAILVHETMAPSELAERVRTTLAIPTAMNGLFGCDWNDINEVIKSGRTGRLFFATGKGTGKLRGLDAVRAAHRNLEDQGCVMASTTGTVFVIRRPVQGNCSQELKSILTALRHPFPVGSIAQGYAYDAADDTVEVDIVAVN